MPESVDLWSDAGEHVPRVRAEAERYWRARWAEIKRWQRSGRSAIGFPFYWQPEDSRKERSTTPYVRDSRTYAAALDVRQSPAMLMAATDDAKARRKLRIAVGLRAIRERAALTQEQLGQRSGMTRIRVNEYENAVHEPSAEKLEAFATALGVETWSFEALGTQMEAEC